MSAPRRIAIFPALVRSQTLGGCERRLFLMALFAGGFPALYGGLFARRLWVIGVGLGVFVALVAVFRAMTKHDPFCRQVVVNTTYYSDRYVAVARWDRESTLGRYE